MKNNNFLLGIRKTIINYSLLIGGVFGAIAFLTSDIFVNDISLNIYDLSELFIILLCLFTWIFRNKIPFKLKLYMIIFLVFYLSLSGLYNNAYLSHNSILVLFIPFFSYLGIGKKPSILLITIFTLGYFSFYFLYKTEVLSLNFAYDERILKANHWINRYLMFVIVSTTIVIMINAFNKYFIALITKLNKNQQELIQHRDHLSTLVNNKTQELRNVNEELLSTNEELSATLKYLKDTQVKLIQSEKMASLGTLTAGIAHEINNPLNFITGGLNILNHVKDEIKVTSQLSPDIESRLDFSIKTIDLGLERSINIVNGLMTFSFNGKSNLIESDIHKIINSTLLFLKSKMANKIEIVKNFSLQGFLRLYPEKMHQILLNILDNAIFATLNQDFYPPRININTFTQGNSAVIQIVNTGPAIKEENIGQLFDPFFTTKEPGKGTGLGLSICYTLIKEHKGDITIENTESGVCFNIKIPLVNSNL